MDTPIDAPAALAADRALTLPALVRARAVDSSDDVFLQEVDGQSQTYSEVLNASLAFASGLSALGVAPGEHVAGMLPPGLAAHHLWLGCSLLGAIEVPLNTDYRTAMLSYALDDAGAAVIVTARKFVPVILEVAPKLASLRHVVVVDGWLAGLADGEVADAGVDVVDLTALLERTKPLDLAEAAQPRPEDTASIIYTSGTTGPSKAVKVRWGQLQAGIGLGPTEWFDQGDAYYSPYPTYHVSAKVPLVFMARVRGRVVIRSQFSMSSLWEDIRRYRIASMAMVGSVAAFVYSQLEDPADRNHHLKFVVMGPGIPQVDDFSRRFGVKVINGYGMTEIGWPLINYQVDGSSFDSVGTGRPDYELRIVRPDGRNAGVDETGELAVRASHPAMLNAGYHNKPDAEAAAWDGDWFFTGDAFRRDADGNYYFVDRLKDTIRRRGENISSFEVENALSIHDAVAEVAAVAVDSDIAEDEVLAIVVPRAGHEIDPVEFFAWADENLPRFMSPRFLQVVSELPKTDTGKVRKVALRGTAPEGMVWDKDALNEGGRRADGRNPR